MTNTAEVKRKGCSFLIYHENMISLTTVEVY